MIKAEGLECCSGRNIAQPRQGESLIYFLARTMHPSCWQGTALGFEDSAERTIIMVVTVIITANTYLGLTMCGTLFWACYVE